MSSIFYVKNATPVAASTIVAADRIAIGDMSTDGWVVLTMDSMLDACFNAAGVGLQVATAGKFLSNDGADFQWADIDLSGYATTLQLSDLQSSVNGQIEDIQNGTLAQFAETTSAQLAGVLSDETGTGLVVFSDSPTITTPIVSGTLTVRQPGGTAGTHEVQISHNGANGVVQSIAGRLYLVAGSQTTEIISGFGIITPGTIRVGVVQFTNTDVILQRVSNRVLSVEGSGATGGTIRSTPLPWVVSGTVTNANPGVARNYELTGDSTPIVDTIAISQVNGQEFTVVNIAATPVVFRDQSTASGTPANKMICPGGADVTLNQYEVLRFVYLSSQSRFLVRKI